MPDLLEGRIPEADKAYLRELETVSLSDLARDVRSLTQNMNTLTNLSYKLGIPLLVAILSAIIINLLLGK